MYGAAKEELIDWYNMFRKLVNHFCSGAIHPTLNSRQKGSLP